MASGALASSGVQQQCADTTGETGTGSCSIPAKHRRLARTNTIDEIRLKGKKRKRRKREEKKLSKKAIVHKHKATFQKRVDFLKEELSTHIEKERNECV